MIHKNDVEVVKYLVDGHGLNPNQANDVSGRDYLYLELLF